MNIGITKKIFFFAIPAFALWMLCYNPILSPAFAATSNWVLAITFSPEKLKLEAQENGNWHLKSNVLMKEQTKKHQNIILLENQALTQNRNFTLGLPIFWAIFWGVSTFGLSSLRHFLFGTALMSSSIFIAEAINAVNFSLFMLDGALGQRIYIGLGIYSTVPPVSSISLNIIEGIRKVFYYANIIFFPLFFVWLFQRESFNKLIPSTNKPKVVVTDTSYEA